MKKSDKEALCLLIEYAKAEAQDQRAAFTAYLLELARVSVDAPERVMAENLERARVQ
jgi:hypothetical protein